MVGCVGESKRYKRTVEERKFTAWASNINNFSSSTVVNGSINNTRYSVLYDSSFSFKAHATFMAHALHNLGKMIGCLHYKEHPHSLDHRNSEPTSPYSRLTPTQRVSMATDGLP